jgi:hypothetical protein
LSDNPQKVNGLAGITLGACVFFHLSTQRSKFDTCITNSIVQSISTVIAGSILGLVFVWKLALVGIACIPLLVSTGYIRLVCGQMKINLPSTYPSLIACCGAQRSSQQEGPREFCSSGLRGSRFDTHRRSFDTPRGVLCSIQPKLGRTSEEIEPLRIMEQPLICPLPIHCLLRHCSDLLVRIRPRISPRVHYFPVLCWSHGTSFYSL